MFYQRDESDDDEDDANDTDERDTPDGASAGDDDHEDDEAEVVRCRSTTHACLMRLLVACACTVLIA